MKNNTHIVMWFNWYLGYYHRCGDTKMNRVVLAGRPTNPLVGFNSKPVGKISGDDYAIKFLLIWC